MNTKTQPNNYQAGGTGLGQDDADSIRPLRPLDYQLQQEDRPPLLVAEPAPDKVLLRRESISTKQFALSPPVVSPNGRWAAMIAGYSYDDGEIIVWDLELNEGFNLTENFRQRQCYARLSWSPDSESIAAPLKKVSECGHALWVFQISPRAEFFICDNWTEFIWSRDGSQIAYLSNGRNLSVANRDGSGIRDVANHYPTFDLTWVEEGKSKKIAFITGWPNEKQQAWIASIDGQGEIPLSSPIIDNGQSAWRCFDPSFYYRPGSQIVTAIPGGNPEAKPFVPIERIEEIYQRANRAQAIAVANARPLTLQPDPCGLQPDSQLPDDQFIELPAQALSVKADAITTLASFTLTPENIARTITVGDESFELLSIQVKPEGNNQVNLLMQLRYEAQIGELWLDTDRAMVMPMVLHETMDLLYQGEIYHSSYQSQISLAATKIRVAPASGLWSEITLTLWRYEFLIGQACPEMAYPDISELR